MRFQHLTSALVLAWALAMCALGTGAVTQQYPSSPSPSPSPSPYTEGLPILDVYQQTATPRLLTRWRNRPQGYKTLFESSDPPLTLTWEEDFDSNWSGYTAPSVEDANAAIATLNGIIACEEEWCTDPQSQLIQEAVAAVRGEALLGLDLLPPECNGALPNACPATGGRYGPNVINLPALWAQLPEAIVNANPTRSVMVIDTGIRPTHVEFVGNLIPGQSVDLSTATPGPISDTNGHGTHVAGTVFGAWNGQLMAGVVGRALGAACRWGSTDIGAARCINHATNNGFDVINMSFGWYLAARLPAADLWRTAVDRFCQAGGIIAMSAGNDNRDIVSNGQFRYPQNFVLDLAATFPNCILVTASVDQADVLAHDSNFGNGVNVAAPGVRILSAYNRNDVDQNILSGTSMASPHIAGLATLLLNAVPAATGPQVHTCIRTTATRPVAANPTIPTPKPVPGRIADALAAFRCLVGDNVPPTITPRISCIFPNNHRVRQACFTPAQLADIRDNNPGPITSRITGCAPTRMPGCARIASNTTVARNATGSGDASTQLGWCINRLRCTVNPAGNQVCISWASVAHLLRNPGVQVTISATDAAGNAATRAMPVTVRRLRAAGCNAVPL